MRNVWTDLAAERLAADLFVKRKGVGLQLNKYAVAETSLQGNKLRVPGDSNVSGKDSGC